MQSRDYTILKDRHVYRKVVSTRPEDEFVATISLKEEPAYVDRQYNLVVYGKLSYSELSGEEHTTGFVVKLISAYRDEFAIPSRFEWFD